MGKPYKWVLPFCPVIPEGFFDYVAAPFSFIGGMVARNETHLKSIETNKVVKDAIRDGLTVVNLTSGEIHWTQEAEIRDKKLLKSHLIILLMTGLNELGYYEKRLKYLASNKSSSLYSFKELLLNGTSSKESITLNSVKKFVENCLTQFAGILAKYEDGWKKFGEKDEYSNEIIFSARRFNMPLIRLLEFRKIFGNTQLLSCYYEEKKTSTKNKSKHGFYALFIADWVYFNWQRQQGKQS